MSVCFDSGDALTFEEVVAYAAAIVAVTFVVVTIAVVRYKKQDKCLKRVNADIRIAYSRGVKERIYTSDQLRLDDVIGSDLTLRKAYLAGRRGEAVTTLYFTKYTPSLKTYRRQLLK